LGIFKYFRIITENEMVEETSNKIEVTGSELFARSLGLPSRETVKVKAWDIRRDLGVVVQVDSAK